MEYVLVKYHAGEFNLASPKYKGPVRNIPKDEWVAFVECRSFYEQYRGNIQRYFKPLKDKPIVVREGEIHKINNNE